MQVTLGTAVGVDLDHVRPVQNGSRMWENIFPFFSSSSLVNNVKLKGLHCSFILNTRRDVGQTKIQFGPVFSLQKEVASDT